MATAKRIRLGGRADFASRTHVFLGAEGIEIDDHTGFASGRRRRVLFDEVQLVTLDRRRNKLGMIIAAALALFIMGIALIVPVANDPNASRGDMVGYWIVMGVMSSPFLIYIALHLALGVDVITIFGKRSTAQMTFSYRKARAREVFQQLCDAVAEHAKPATVEAIGAQSALTS